MISKELFGVIAVVISLGTYLPYYAGLLKGETKPHVFSWIVWSLILTITCAAQITKGAGAGAWITVLETLGSSGIALFALFAGEKNITRSDWFFFCGALTAIPLWAVTGDPLASAMLVTCIGVASFWPTVRKSWQQPGDEVAVTYILSGPAYACSLLALEKVTLAAAFYPAVFMVVNAAFGIMLLARRQILSRQVRCF